MTESHSKLPFIIPAISVSDDYSQESPGKMGSLETAHPNKPSSPTKHRGSTTKSNTPIDKRKETSSNVNKKGSKVRSKVRSKAEEIKMAEELANEQYKDALAFGEKIRMEQLKAFRRKSSRHLSTQKGNENDDSISVATYSTVSTLEFLLNEQGVNLKGLDKLDFPTIVDEAAQMDLSRGNKTQVSVHLISFN